MICSVDACRNEAVRKGLCWTHYERPGDREVQRHMGKHSTPKERFLEAMFAYFEIETAPERRRWNRVMSAIARYKKSARRGRPAHR